jgi:hypothetical protein
MDKVWVATVRKAHGEENGVYGVYDSREAVFEALKELPNITVWVDAAGNVQGRPVRERDWSKGLYQPYLPEYWATAEAYRVQGRVKLQAASQPRI